MVIMNDLEWPMFSYYVIYYEKFRELMQRTEKVALKSTKTMSRLCNGLAGMYSVLMTGTTLKDYAPGVYKTSPLSEIAYPIVQRTRVSPRCLKPNLRLKLQQI